MGWDVFAYWICFISGVIYASLAALLGGVLGFGHDGLEAGGDIGAAHDFGTAHDVGAGHGEAHAGEGPGEVAISPLSPMTIATFSTVFGGTGLILTKMFNYGLGITLPAAVVAGFFVAWVVFLAFYRLFASVQASSEVQMGALVGLTGEVTVAIPSGGVGEIAYVTLGGRYTSIARSETGQPVERHTPVRVTRVVGNTVYVAAIARDAAAEPPPPQ
jgi:membrane protein implicated in regulation of membrane protease activity